MKHGSLFSGIEGFAKGAELAGIETVWSCELEAYNRKIISKHHPYQKQYADIRDMRNPGYVDIISGGFPCQDISVAGKMEGITGTRSGLWSENFRIIREVMPRYAIIENSPALLIRGFERILLDLSSIGYNAEWQVISNIAFGYPHKRERLYVIAYPYEVRLQGDIQGDNSLDTVFRKWTPNTNDGYSLSKRIHQIPTCPIIRNGDGFRSWSHRVGAIGNAVNPTIAYYLFDCIKEHYSKMQNT